MSPSDLDQISMRVLLKIFFQHKSPIVDYILMGSPYEIRIMEIGPCGKELWLFTQKMYIFWRIGDFSFWSRLNQWFSLPEIRSFTENSTKLRTATVTYCQISPWWSVMRITNVTSRLVSIRISNQLVVPHSTCTLLKC